jgi:putative sterol carrier protein
MTMKNTALALRLAAALAALAPCAATIAADEPPAMSAAWAQSMCAAWNSDPMLTGKLVESGWIKNDSGRGHKVMRIYRSECAQSPRAELRVALKDDKALCTYGGAAGTATLDGGADYLMWADNERWREMGAGQYGPMRAMMFGRLNFEGPKMEAMGNMGPFANFLLLVGKVPGNWNSCP